MKKLLSTIGLALGLLLIAGAGQLPADPRIFGAKCDGTTDDYTAFDKARATGAQILVPQSSSGCVLKSQLQLNSGQTIFGYGRDSLLVQGNYNNVIGLNSNAVVRNLRVNGQYSTAVLQSLAAVSSAATGGTWTVPSGVTSVAMYANITGTATVVLETSPNGAAWTIQSTLSATGENYSIALPGGTTTVRLRVSAYTSGTISGWIVGWGLGSLINSGNAVDGATVENVWLTNAPNDAINFADGSNNTAKGLVIDTFGLEGILATVSVSNNTGITRIDGFEIKNGLKAGIDSNQTGTIISNGKLVSVGLAGTDAATAIWIANNGYDIANTRISNVYIKSSGASAGTGFGILMRALGTNKIDDTQINNIEMQGITGGGIDVELANGATGSVSHVTVSNVYANSVAGLPSFYFGTITGLNLSGVYSEGNSITAFGGVNGTGGIHIYSSSDVVVSGFSSRNTTGSDFGAAHQAAGICVEATDKFILSGGIVRANAGFGVLQTAAAVVGGYAHIHTFGNTGGRFSIQSVNVTAGTNWGS